MTGVGTSGVEGVAAAGNAPGEAANGSPAASSGFTLVPVAPATGRPLPAWLAGAADAAGVARNAPSK